MAKLDHSGKSRQDLAEIWEYIARDKIDAADRFIARIDAVFFLLVSNPFVGRARNEIEEGLRSFPVGQYLILYRQIPGGIEIVRVVHGQRDLGSIRLQ